jgi:uncharacterized protein YqjF (DUF2071 family)
MTTGQTIAGSHGSELPLARRVAECGLPASSAVGYQRWSELLFLHWRVEAALLQATLPPGLRVDTFGGAGYLGIVPFFMERVRPAWLPPVPGISWFHELNVRTYVVDEAGRPGVWFYSLDCDQPSAVHIARRFYHLPYCHARIRSSRDDGVRYEAQRRGETAADRFAWQRGTTAAPAQPGTLDFFLIERYRLFAADPQGRLHTGRVHHEPYQICHPTVFEWSFEVARLAGFTCQGPPVTAHAAARVDVAIHALEGCQ